MKIGILHTMDKGFIYHRMVQLWPLFVYFRSFQQQFLQINYRLLRVSNYELGLEVELGDHLTTTTALKGGILIK